MDQVGMTQVQLALECVSKDLDRVQASLTTYEQQLIKSERVTPQLKDVVTYYREQVTGLRKAMLGMCDLLTSLYKVDLLKRSRKDRVESVMDEARLSAVVEEIVNPERAAVKQPEAAPAATVEDAEYEEEYEDDSPVVVPVPGDVP